MEEEHYKRTCRAIPEKSCWKSRRTVAEKVGATRSIWVLGGRVVGVESDASPPKKTSKGWCPSTGGGSRLIDYSMSRVEILRELRVQYLVNCEGNILRNRNPRRRYRSHEPYDVGACVRGGPMRVHDEVERVDIA